MITATADTRAAQRLCRTVSTALVSSTVTALKRMGAAVRGTPAVMARESSSMELITAQRARAGVPPTA